MKINVRRGTETFSVEIDPTVTVSDLKKAIQPTISVPLPDFRVIFKGKILTNDQILGTAGITDGESVQVIVVKSSEPKPTASAPPAPEQPVETPAPKPAATSNAQASPLEGLLEMLNGQSGQSLMGSNPMDATGDSLQNPELMDLMNQLMANPEAMQEAMQLAQGLVGPAGSGGSPFISSTPLPPENRPPPYTGEITDDSVLRIFGVQRTPEVEAYLQKEEIRKGFNLIKEGIALCGGPEAILQIDPTGAGAQIKLAVPLNQPQTEFATQLAQLNQMGYSDNQRNIQALKETNGNVDMAIFWLYNHPPK